MAKKKNKLKNYLTRDEFRGIVFWYQAETKPAKDPVGEFGSHNMEDTLSTLDIPNDIYKAINGNLPRMGTCREFKRGESNE